MKRAWHDGRMHVAAAVVSAVSLGVLITRNDWPGVAFAALLVGLNLDSAARRSRVVNRAEP